MNHEETFNPETPHHGPISPGCPLECLRTVLSQHAFRRLLRADDPPRTVGDVIKLCTSGELRDIHGLGRRRVSEIETALVFAGLDITVHHDGQLPENFLPPVSFPYGAAHASEIQYVMELPTAAFPRTLSS